MTQDLSGEGHSTIDPVGNQLITVALLSDEMESEVPELQGKGIQLIVIERSDDDTPWCHLFCLDKEVSNLIRSKIGTELTAHQVGDTRRVRLAHASANQIVEQLRQAGLLAQSPSDWRHGFPIHPEFAVTC